MDKILKATHGSDKTVIKLSQEIEIPCYVLEDGQRVLNRAGILKSLGMSTSGGTGGAQRLVQFAQSKSLISLISSETMARIENPIKFTTSGGSQAYGYEATILVDICDAVIQARKNGSLHKQQSHIAEQAEILIRAFAKTGIIALVDEVTGYQYDRERDELQKILKKYISEELLPWEKRFPDEFYREIFRLNEWDFTVAQIKSGARPGVIGKWTKKYIYSVLPKGVLQALLNKTPKNEKGKLTRKLHQSLTREQGIEHLNKQIISTVTLMNVSDSWKEFEKMWSKKFGQQEMQFEDAKLLEPDPEGLSNFDENLKKALNYKPKT